MHFQVKERKLEILMADWKKEKKSNILKAAREQIKARKKMLKEVRDSIEKRNGREPKI